MEVEEEQEQELIVVKPSAGKDKEKEHPKELGGKKKNPEKVSKPAAPVEGTSGTKSGQVSPPAASDADDETDTGLEELNHPPCKRCAKNKILCMVQPEPKKSGVKDKRIHNQLVCVACWESKSRCKLAARKIKSPTPEPASAPLHLAKEAKETPTPPKAKRAPKKNLLVVPPGGPGEFTSQLPHIVRLRVLTYV